MKAPVAALLLALLVSLWWAPLAAAQGTATVAGEHSSVVNLYFHELFHELPAPACTNCGPLDDPARPTEFTLYPPPAPSTLGPPRFVKVLPK